MDAVSVLGGFELIKDRSRLKAVGHQMHEKHGFDIIAEFDLTVLKSACIL